MKLLIFILCFFQFNFLKATKLGFLCSKFCVEKKTYQETPITIQPIQSFGKTLQEANRKLHKKCFNYTGAKRFILNKIEINSKGNVLINQQFSHFNDDQNCISIP